MSAHPRGQKQTEKINRLFHLKKEEGPLCPVVRKLTELRFEKQTCTKLTDWPSSQRTWFSPLERYLWLKLKPRSTQKIIFQSFFLQIKDNYCLLPVA